MAGTPQGGGLLGRERRLRREADRLSVVLRSMSVTLDPAETLERIARAGLDLLEADSCGVALIEPDGVLRYRAVCGDDRGAGSQFAIPPGQGFVGRAFSEGRAQRVDDLLAASGSFRPELDRESGFRTLLASPLLIDGRPLGVLTAVSLRVAAFDEDDERLLERLADHAAIALDRARQHAASRARAEELAILGAELRESEARVRALTDALLEAVYEADMSQPHRPTGVVRFYSANVEQVLGYPPQAWYEDDALWVKGLHPDDRDRSVNAHAELRAHGTTLDIEYRFVKPNGEVVWIEDRARLERGPAGEPRVLRGTNADVTARKRLEERLRRSENDARALYQAALAAGEEIDPHARLERVLDATLELIGVTEAQIALLDPEAEAIEVVAARGDHLRDLHLQIPFGEGLYSIVIAENRSLRIADMQADERTFRGDLAADQGFHAFLAVPLTDSAGASGALGVVSHERDVFNAEHERLLALLAALASAAVRESRLRERLAEAEALRELARLKDEFLATVSHELRTPLSLVCGYTELMLTRQFPEEQTLDAIAEVSRAANTMARLVDDLLDLGRVERGELHLNLATIDLPTELHQTVGRFAGHSGVHELRVEVAPDLPKASADLARVRQVLDNLVENALRYALPGPIVLRASRDRTMLRVEVEDCGPGVPQELTSRIFEKFYRGPDARLSRERGTGIGLSVVKQLIEAQGGDVGVRPSARGGSIFWFSLNPAG